MNNINVLEDIPSTDLKNIVMSLKRELKKKNNTIDSLYKKIAEIKTTFQMLFERDELIYNSKKELEMIFDASDDYIVILDKNHIIKRVNKRFCDLINLHPKKVIGTKLSDWFGQDLTNKVDFDNVEIPKDFFLETVFYSNTFKKTFMIRSRKLKPEFEPLVYLHITRTITEDLKDKEC